MGLPVLSCSKATTGVFLQLLSVLFCCCGCSSFRVQAARVSASSPTATAAAAAARGGNHKWHFIASSSLTLTPSARAAGEAAVAASSSFLPFSFLSKSPLWGPLSGVYTPGLTQYRHNQVSLQLQAKCCFDITLPEDTKNRRSRKGSSRNALKRLLKIPRGGWKNSSSKPGSSSSSSNSRNTSSNNSNKNNTALRCSQNDAVGNQPPTSHTSAAAAAAAAAATTTMEASRFIDIGANLCDPMYTGKYFDKQKHPEDTSQVLGRAEAAGVKKIILTTGSFEDFHTNLKLAETHDPECRRLFMTVGIHPTRCNEFAVSSSSNSSSNSSSSDSRIETFIEKVEDAGLQVAHYPEVYVHRLFELQQLLQQQQQQQQQRIVAVGEIGLDYDRLHFCDAATQKQCFELQLALSYTSGLPLFLHMRNTAQDFLEILKRRENLWRVNGGVAHSFTGTAEEAKQLLDAGLFIGINGCSLKTEENLNVVKQLPLSRILLETDAPWCGLRPTHAGFSYLSDLQKSHLEAVKPEKWTLECQVRNRNEPCNIRAVGEIVHRLVAPEMSAKDFFDAIYRNTTTLFKLP